MPKRKPQPEPFPEPAPLPPPTTSGKRMWAGPIMSNPKIVELGGSDYGAKKVIDGLGGDVLAKIVAPVTRRPWMRNVRNFRIIGGEIRIDDEWLYDYGGATTYKDDRMGFMFDGVSGIVDIEGVLMHGAKIIEGIDVGAWSGAPTRYPQAIQIQNCRIVGLKKPDDTWHPDCVQIWGGALALRMYNVSMESDYQCFMAKANKNRLGSVEMVRVNMRGHAAEVQKAYLLNHVHGTNDNGNPFCESISYGGDGSIANRVLIRRPIASLAPGDYGHSDFRKVATPNAYNTSPNKAVLGTENGRNYLTWPTATLPRVAGRVWEHLSGEPDYVPAGSVGMGYIG